MSTVQLEFLWKYIDSLGLSKKNRKWLADKLIEPTAKEKEKANETTLAAIKEAREDKTTSFNSFDEFKQHLYEL